MNEKWGSYVDELAEKLENQKQQIIANVNTTEKELEKQEEGEKQVNSELSMLKGQIILLEKNNEKIKNASENILKISALNKTGLEELYNKITEMFNLNEINLDNELLITNVRHKNIIEKAIQNVKMANEALLNGMPIDIITIYIKQILDDLGEITGDCVTEDIINEIFSKFCLGK